MTERRRSEVPASALGFRTPPRRTTIPTEAERFAQALDRFKDAAVELSDAWQEVADYPAYLPSFDEFVADVMAIRPTKEEG